MNTDLEQTQWSRTTNRKQFSLLLNPEEYAIVENLSSDLGISKGATIRCAVKNLLHTKETGKVTTPMQVDTFWQTFRGKN